MVCPSWLYPCIRSRDTEGNRCECLKFTPCQHALISLTACDTALGTKKAKAEGAQLAYTWRECRKRPFSRPKWTRASHDPSFPTVLGNNVSFCSHPHFNTGASARAHIQVKTILIYSFSLCHCKPFNLSQCLYVYIKGISLGWVLGDVWGLRPFIGLQGFVLVGFEHLWWLQPSDRPYNLCLWSIRMCLLSINRKISATSCDLKAAAGLIVSLGVIFWLVHDFIAFIWNRKPFSLVGEIPGAVW